MQFLKSLAAFLFWLLAPIILLVVGGLVIGFGLQQDWFPVVVAGGVLALAGLIWGFLRFMAAESGSIDL
jgi:hypothetical protein